MKTRSRILLSVLSSLAVSIVIALIAFSILKGINTELKRSELYGDILDKTHALNILTASLREGSGQNDIRQVRAILLSLDSLLKGISSRAPREEILIRQLQKNNQDLEPLIDLFFVSGPGMSSGLEIERRHILASQIWMKVRFISDDTSRLMDISQSRIIAAQGKAGAMVIVLIVILALTNGGIYFFSGRGIVRAQEALRQSEERFRVTLSSIGDAVIAADASGRVTFLNPKAEGLTGWTSGDAVRQPIQSVFQIINEQTRQPAENIVENVLRQGGLVSLANQTILITRDGREIPVEDSAAPIRDRAGNIIGVVLVFHDVTDRRRTQEALRESEEHYRSLFDNMLNGYAYCRMLFEEGEPKDFIYLNVNSTFETLTGLRNVTGKKVSEVIPGIQKSDPALFEIYGRVAITGLPERFETYLDALNMWLSISVYSPRKEHFVAIFDVITERKEAEQALKESENRLRRFYESGLLGVIYWNMNGEITDANDKFLEMGGYDRGDLAAGRIDWGLMTPPEYRHLDERSAAELKATGINKTPFEKEYIRKDGTRLPIMVAGAMLDEARFNGVAFVLDISDRKQAESERERLAQQRQLALDAAEMGWWHYDPVTRVSSWDDRYKEIFGVAGYSRPTDEILTRLHPDDLPGVWAKVEAALDPVNPQVYSAEYRINLPDGSMKWIEAHGIASFEGTGENRRATSFVGTVADITERKQADEVIRRSEAMLRAVLDRMPSGVTVRDARTGELLLSNPRSREIIGVLADNLEQFTCYRGFYPDGRPYRTEDWPVNRTVTTGEVVEGEEIDCERSDGARITISVSSAPIRDAQGRITFGVSVFHDITERKRMEEALRKSHEELELRIRERTAELHANMKKLTESNQALQDFASIASHDLQEPLRKVQSFGNMLKQKAGGALGEQGNDYLERILNANGRMQTLLTALLEYSRLSTRAHPFVDVSLTRTVHEVLSDLEVTIEKTGGEVQVEELPVIQADPTQMRQLFQNLIGNGLKFHKEGEKPVIKVRSTAMDNSALQIVVEDNGIGFDEQFLHKIFAPFQRLHGRSGPYEGTGMGLAICKKIVERHGGSLTARSLPGKGSTFIITLPFGSSSTSTKEEPEGI